MRDYSMPNLSLSKLDGSIVRFEDIESQNAYDSPDNLPLSRRSRVDSNNLKGKLPKTKTYEPQNAYSD